MGFVKRVEELYYTEKGLLESLITFLFKEWYNLNDILRIKNV